MKTPLYELAAQYRGLSQLEDMDPEAIADTLEALEGDIEERAQAIVAVRAGMDSDLTAIDTQITRLNDIKRVIQNREARLRDYLKTNMKSAGITNIKCPLFSITLAKGREVLQIDDESVIPDEYMVVETTIKPDKKRLLGDIKAGNEIPGCRAVRSDESLRIK